MRVHTTHVSSRCVPCEPHGSAIVFVNSWENDLTILKPFSQPQECAFCILGRIGEIKGSFAEMKVSFARNKGLFCGSNGLFFEDIRLFCGYKGRQKAKRELKKGSQYTAHVRDIR